MSRPGMCLYLQVSDARNKPFVMASKLSPGPGKVWGCDQPSRPWLMGEGATLTYGSLPVSQAVTTDTVSTEGKGGTQGWGSEGLPRGLGLCWGLESGSPGGYICAGGGRELLSKGVSVS